MSSACGNQPKNETSTESKKIDLGLMSDTTGIPLIVAQELGYFTDENVDIDLHVFFSAIDRDAAVQANQLNSMTSDLVSVGLLKESGSEFVVISKTETEYKLLTSPEEESTTLDSFQNKKIGLSTNTLMEYLVDMVITEHNLENIEKVNIPKMPTRLEMLSNNQINGAILPEPLATLSVNQGSSVLVSNKDLDLYPGVLIFNEEFIKENEDVMVGFVNAYNRATDYIATNGIEEFRSQINETLSFSDEGFDTFKDSKFTHISLPPEKSISSAMNWLYEKEMISKVYTYDEVTYDINN
jgi:NitT/TauT family transport system substrate-binding protein